MSENEKQIMLEIFCHFEDFDEVQQKMGVTHNQIIQSTVSVHKKYQLEMELKNKKKLLNKYKK